MPWKNRILYFLAAGTLMSLQLRDGHAVDSQAAVQRPSSAGHFHFRSVNHESVAPARHGSLSFKFDEHGEQKPTPVLHNLMNAKLKRMDPSVQCSDNLMTLKVNRVRAPHFLVDSGEGPLTPLSQMPSKCGFSVKRSRRDVHVAVPYQGCHVTQQGGDYVLPLRLWGSPMSMSCPVVSPPPSVSCFPSGMVVKVGGITANALKVKVSGKWKPLSSVCSSCGLAVEVGSGGLKLTAPYNRGLCVEIEDEEYLLSILLVDVELLATCPLPTTTTTMTTMPPSGSGQYPQYPQFPMFPHYPVFPGPTPPAQTPAPTTAMVAPQRPQLPTGAAPDSEEAPAAQRPEFPFMPQFPHFSQFPQFPLFPRPVPPTQPSANKNTATPPAQEPQMPQFPMFPQYPVFPGPTPPAQTPAPTTAMVAPQRPQLPTGAAPDSEEAPAAQRPEFPFMPQFPHFSQFPQFPLFPRPVPPTQPSANKNTAPPLAQEPQMLQFPMFPQYPVFPGPTPPAQTPAPTTAMVAPQHPQLPTGAAPDSKEAPAAQRPEFPFMPQFPHFSQFPQFPLFPRPVPPTQPSANKNTATPPAQEPQMPQFPQFPRPVPQQPKPHIVHPQTYQIPVLYPPPKYPPQKQNTQTAAPATTTTTNAATTLKPEAQKPFYYPHPYMPPYFVPQQPVFPDFPPMPPANPAPSEVSSHQGSTDGHLEHFGLNYMR